MKTLLELIQPDANSEILQIPPDLLRSFAPATHCLYEWADYWLTYPEADRVRAGGTWLTPVTQNVFRIRFENQIGLTTIQPYAGSVPLTLPWTVEILSRKFPTPTRHLEFLRSLLDDLFARAAHLPFTINAPTSRAVSESVRPPTNLFTYHFLCQSAATLRTALNIIQLAPHRRLTDHAEWLPLAQASDADRDVLIELVRASQDWTRAQGFPLAEKLKGFAPTRVWQRTPTETYDTPENRFVLAFLHQLLKSAEALYQADWWGSVPADRQQMIHGITKTLQRTIHLPLFDEVGPMTLFPSASQVLIRRDGYRELFGLWQRFHHARRPWFEALRQAMDIRDVAQLYEMWVFLALIEELAIVTQQAPTIDLQLTESIGMGWNAKAQFGAHGILYYNKDQRKNSYSIPFRPDMSWVRDGQLELVLDAKFRLESFATLGAEDMEAPESQVKRDDLYKMHTYRDALGVRAAIAIYPGNQPTFFDRQQGRHSDLTLGDVLKGTWTGIGALGMYPQPKI